jgi:predicted GNAT family acetyltransferase
MTTSVVERPDVDRYELHVDGDGVAGFVTYRRAPGEIAFLHTEIDPAYEGKGLGSVLARRVLDAARDQGLAVLPYCPFIRGWIARHPDYVDLVPAARRAAFQL